MTSTQHCLNLRNLRRLKCKVTSETPPIICVFYAFHIHQEKKNLWLTLANMGLQWDSPPANIHQLILNDTMGSTNYHFF